MREVQREFNGQPTQTQMVKAFAAFDTDGSSTLPRIRTPAAAFLLAQAVRIYRHRLRLLRSRIARRLGRVGETQCAVADRITERE